MGGPPRANPVRDAGRRVTRDERWPRAGEWIRGEHPGAALGRLGIVGAPVCRGSITPGRCDLAPQAIRAALDRFSTYDVDGERDVRDIDVLDFGNRAVADLQPEQAFEPVRDAVRVSVEQSDATVVLGGDNSITRPGVHALSDCCLLTLDAHLDLRDLEKGLTNGNPIRALLADGISGERIVQIGIQSFANSAEYAAVAREAGIRVVTMDRVSVQGLEVCVQEALDSFGDRAVYVDLDMDVLDRAFSPATPGSRPGGVSPAELRRAVRICGERPNVRVMDIVEIDPEKDIGDRTSLAAAACLLSFASGVLKRCLPSPTARRF